MIFVLGAEDFEACGNAIASECLRQQRIRSVETEIDEGLRRESHTGRSPSILGRECRPALPVDLAAQQIETRLPRILLAVFETIAAIVDARELQRGPLGQADANAGAHS